jgi:copper oxidase (laccase) domain-containing protein
MASPTHAFEDAHLVADVLLPSDAVPEGLKITPTKLPHKTDIVIVETGEESLADCDALVTANRAFSLGMRTADCAAICFGDGEKIGVAHAGWRGLCLGMVEKMLGHFSSSTVTIYVAPFLHSFEIQKDFCYDQIQQKFGDRFITEDSGKTVFQFKEAIASLVPPNAIFDERSTVTDLSLPSYRRDKTTERLLTVVRFPA